MRGVDFEALNADPTAFVVTAVDVVSACSPASGTIPTPERARTGRRRSAKPTCLRDRAPAYPASGNPSPQFPWVEIGGASYWDGGLVDNTPLGDAIDAFSDDPDADRRLVVMNLYPLRARLPQNLAEVQDRVHELSFGNRLRQDHDGATRVNDLVGTICELAALAPKGAITGDLKRRSTAPTASSASRSSTSTCRTPSIRPCPAEEAEQDPADDQDGLRDFSPAAVERRRAHG